MREQVLERGERLDLLVDKTDLLQVGALAWRYWGWEGPAWEKGQAVQMDLLHVGGASSVFRQQNVST